MPGSQGIPLYRVGKFIYEESKKDNITTRSNSIAFSLFVSIFPFIIFLFTLLPYLPFTNDYTNTISTSTEKFLPKNAHDYLMVIIRDITNIKREGLLSLGFILAFYFSSDGMLTLMQGFDKTYKISFRNRKWWYKRAIALLLTILLGILLVLSITLLIMGENIFGLVSNVVHNDLVTLVLYRIMRWLSAFVILYLGINTIYYFGPSLRKNLPFINPGSIVASTLSLLSSLLFAYFVNSFGQYNQLYGSIGALLVVLLWLKINAFILLAGFELNAAIAVNRDLKLAAYH
ncbi:MAG: YihY/virulence factor BrkB family protein [Saprospiraceae bacterium]|nr:YihY/virulence factor BrkB family protein [Saprospiraceae bacterium]